MPTSKPLQDLARDLARSGKFAGWRAIAFELQFEPGYAQAAPWLYQATTQDELNQLCRNARQRPVRSDPAVTS
jgi:hypothetical protein